MNVRQNLVALGSAAVLTVYTAGFVRTRPAAQRFAEESTARRPSAPERALPQDQAAVTIASPAPASSAVSTASPAAPRAAGKDSQPPVKTAVTVAVATPDAAPPAQPAQPTQPAPSAPPGTAATSPVADTTQHAADAPVVQWKDGYYFGWGTSRHGDIQAAVEIQSGKIVAATITQCLTRYSCSWISALPPQVVLRQSPDVDYVSGATQSANAFYYAVASALKQAR